MVRVLVNDTDLVAAKVDQCSSHHSEYEYANNYQVEHDSVVQFYDSFVAWCSPILES